MSDMSLSERLAAISPNSTLVMTHYGRKTGKAYHVTIWFLVEGEKMFLATANIDRQWTRNVMKRPEVELQAGAEKFKGKVRPITDRAERQHVMDLVARKYIAARVFMWLTPILFALFQDRRAAFEVAIES